MMPRIASCQLLSLFLLFFTTIDTIFSLENNNNKIGLAPHERSSCQLANLAHFNGAISLVDQDQHTAPPNPSLYDGSKKIIINQDADNKENKLKISTKFDSSDRLRRLRLLMSASGYDAYLVTPQDEHGSEYISEQDKRLHFISGFTGSRGYALILMDRAVFLPDGRYSLQAEQELDCNWWVISDSGSLLDMIQWLKQNTAKGLKIALNARLISLQEYEMLENRVHAIESKLILLSQDLVDSVWNDMPGAAHKLQATAPIEILAPKFAGGTSWQQKLLRLSDRMDKLQYNNFVMTALDEIAWLFNLRGGDIPHNPFFKAFAFITKYQSQQPIQQQVIPIHLSSNHQTSPHNNNNLLPEIENTNLSQLYSSSMLRSSTGDSLMQTRQVIKVTFYTDLKRITPALRDYLGVDNSTIAVRTITNEATGLSQKSNTQILVNLIDYNLFIKDLSEKFSTPDKIIGRLAIPIASNVAVHTMAKNYLDRVILMESLIVPMKGVKSDGEVNNMRLAHARDSLAISMLFAQLEYDIQGASTPASTSDQQQSISATSSNSKWNEISAADRLTLYRSLMDNNRGLSFETISAFGSNGAIIHYAPSEATSKTIDNSSLYLLDSGGQYLDGTTDITRTVHFGEPTDWQKETYTRVLMGSIDIMALIFPNGVNNNSGSTYKISDILARRHLYDIGLDYQHGTGHGIGAYGTVHEAPHIIAAQGRSDVSNIKTTSTSGVPIFQQSMPIQANMMTSVEPGYYQVNDFGIRLENIVVVKNIDDQLFEYQLEKFISSSSSNLKQNLKKNKSGKFNLASRMEQSWQSGQDQMHIKPSNMLHESSYLGFEPLSLVPFEPKLIKYHLLSDKQKSWLNDYNQLTRQRLIALIKEYMMRLDGQQQQMETKKRYRAMLHSDNIHYNQNMSMHNKQQFEQNNNNNNLYKGLIDKEQFRQALQRAHVWILSKTEPIKNIASTISTSDVLVESEKTFNMINSPLSYSGQFIDANNQDDMISNYRCNNTTTGSNSKSCGLFMMAVNRFQSSSNHHLSNGVESQSQSQFSNYVILFMVLIQTGIMFALYKNVIAS